MAERFDPGRHLSKLSGKDYLEVKWRLVWFREEWPHGRILTEAHAITDEVAVFKATVIKADQEATELGVATGYGSETPKDFRDYIEKAETKAIGRALAALGYGTQFAPELEEGERIVDAPVQRAQRPQEARNGPPPPSGPNGGGWRPSEAQGKRIHAMRSKAGLSQEDVKVYMLGRYGTERLAEVTREQYDDLGTWLDGMIGGEEWAIRAAAPGGAAQAPMGGLPEPDELGGPDRWT